MPPPIGAPPPVPKRCSTHTPTLHIEPARRQSLQLEPPNPHAEDVVPDSQRPSAVQQPSQFDGPHAAFDGPHAMLPLIKNTTANARIVTSSPLDP